MFQNTRQIILKVTRGCPYNCKYCYVLDKDKYSDEVISDDVFNLIINKLLSESKHFDTSGTEALSIVFHGGEPLSIGKDKISQFSKIIQQKAKQYGKNVALSIQTNGGLIDEEWIDLFRYYKINVGISWDGFRADSENRAQAEIVLNNILLMKALDAPVGALMILHKQNYKTVVRNLKILNTIGIHVVKINRAVDVMNVGNFELNSDELLEAAKDIFNFMITNPFGIKEDVIYNKMMKMTDGVPYGHPMFRNNICYSRYCGAGSNILEIEPDGTLLMCGRNSKKHDLVAQSINEKDFCELNAFYHMWKFQISKVKAINTMKCNLCPAQNICDYGCLSFSWQKFEGDMKIDPITCEYNKKLFTYLNQNYQIIVEFFNKLKEKKHI